LRELGQRLVNPQGQVRELLELLRPEEVVSLHKRLEWVLQEGAYPGLPGRRRR
jgi:hypothetical protein